MSHANNGQEKYAKYQPDIYVSMRDISGQKTNVTMARNSKFFKFLKLIQCLCLSKVIKWSQKRGNL